MCKHHDGYSDLWSKRFFTVKPVYNGQSQMWPLLTGGLCLEHRNPTIRFSRDELRLLLLLIGLTVHVFSSEFDTGLYQTFIMIKKENFEFY